MALSLKLTALASAATLVLLTACNSTTTNEESEQFSLKTNLAIESRLMSDYELIKTVSSQVDQSNIYDVAMQPVNKKEKCLLPFMVSDGSDTKMYWDGQCEDGKAVGLGRAVRTLNDKKITELLLEIDPKVKDTLVSYLRYDVTNTESEIGYSVITLKDDKLSGYCATLGYKDDEWLNGSFEFTYRYEDTPNFVSYTKIIDLLSGEFSSIIAYPNFSHDLLNAHDNVLSNIDRTYRLLEGRTMMGISYIWLKDGRLLLKDNATGQDRVATNHPEELESFVQDIQDRVSLHVEKANLEVKKGFAKVEEYSLQKCKRPEAFFKGDEVNHICDYLFNVNAAYDELLKAKELRSHEIDSFRQNQEERLKEIDKHIRAFNKVKLQQLSHLKSFPSYQALAWLCTTMLSQAKRISSSHSKS